MLKMLLKDAFLLGAISQSIKSSRVREHIRSQRLAFHAGLIKKPAIITLVGYLSFPGIFVVLFSFVSFNKYCYICQRQSLLPLQISIGAF